MALTVLLAGAAVVAVPAAVSAAPSRAADPLPEITRGAIAPQAIGAAHTLRQIPEACARIEGVFTGDAAKPYRFAVVRTSANCQPRARFVDAGKAKPSVATGWKFNDLIRVASSACPTQQAVVRVWRKPVDQTQKLDGQGQSRIYLEESKQAAAAGRIAAVPMFAAAMSVEGKACGG
ncbi:MULTISPECIES: hypothetical protein [unclassified Luteimonas]|uniref:hypothetical protein n=1 Tax=unclassified Luteimonas TaxID=2629088 RepID=UPI00160135AF|nr:hypothetical protein [Luteimonas sp. MC1825]MBB1473656.1 hypothetical protein [Luteimonas sp. MC1782]MBB6600129.1 hypothetical protein [Luteimonas sp. MC1825]QOC89592.1 hypothetical protein IDM46_11415 [Luteimonas sp. MC1825]